MPKPGSASVRQDTASPPMVDMVSTREAFGFAAKLRLWTGSRVVIGHTVSVGKRSGCSNTAQKAELHRSP